MSKDELNNFIDNYNFVDSRCEQYVKYVHPGTDYNGIEISNNDIFIMYSYNSCGDIVNEFDRLTDMDIINPDIDLKDKYQHIIAAYEQKQAEKREKLLLKEREQAAKEIERLKQKYNL